MPVLKRIIILLFSVFNFTLSFAQMPSCNKNWGTIKVKKIRSNHVLPKPASKKRLGIRVFWGRFNGSDYKETFPASYKSQLYPLVFNAAGLILTDENKQWSSNTIRGYDYEIFIGNAAGFKVNSTFSLDLNASIRLLKRGEYLWVTKLYYTDKKGAMHSNEIGEFKVEKVR